MRDLRVCHLLHDLALGGLENQVLRNVRATNEPAISFVVCFVGTDNSMATEFTEAGAEVVHLDTGSTDPLDQFRPRSLLRLRQFLVDNEIDILHCHGSLYQHVVGRLCGSTVGCPVMGTYHTRREMFHPGTRLLERLTRPLSAIDIAVSKGVERSFTGTAQEYEPGQWSPNRRTFTVYNGIDVERFHERVAKSKPEQVDASGSNARGVTYLNIGRYSSSKNQLALIKSMERVVANHPRAHLYLVGWGDGEESLHAAVERHDLVDNITVTGRVSPNFGDVPSVYDYYALADVFVLPSRTEGLSVVLLEAMATPLPIIATSIPGNVEAVIEGETGLLVPSNDVEALADALIQLTDTDTQKRFAENGYEHAKKRFHIQTTVRSYEDIYQQIG